MENEPPRRELYSDDRIPALVKHELLENYLEQLAMRVGLGGWDSLLFLDAFAGPWGSSADCRDSSFGVAVATLAKVQRILNDKFTRTLALHGYLIERDPKAFPLLAAFAEKHNGRPVRLIARQGEFEEHIPDFSSHLSKLGNSSFRFLLLDPKGWKGLAMAKVRTIAQARSSEILVNVMVKHLVRFLKEDDRAESYADFFGRNDVREIVHAAPKDERPDVLVREYCKSLKSICGYKYVSSCMILNEDKSQTRYFMVFATNHHKGIEVFKDAETKAAKLQTEVVSNLKKKKREDRTGGMEMPLFDESGFIQRKRSEYAKKAFSQVRKELERKGHVLYRDLFCEAAAFPLVTRAEIHNELRSMRGIRIELEKIGERKRLVPNCDYEDMVISI